MIKTVSSIYIIEQHFCKKLPIADQKMSPIFFNKKKLLELELGNRKYLEAFELLIKSLLKAQTVRF